MKFNELLNKDIITLIDFESYVEEKGLHKIKRKDLDLLLKLKGNKLMLMKDFKDVYEIAILNEGTRMTNIWGIVTVITVVVGIIVIKFL
jgi:hypothetical protein